MLNKSHLFAFFIFIFCYYTSAGQLVIENMSENASSDSINCQKLKQELKVQINHLIAVKYSEICEKRSLSPPIGYLGWEKVKMYWEAVPKLQEGRNNFEKAYQKLISFIDEKTRTDSVIRIVSIRRENEEYNTWKLRVNDELIKRYPSEYIVLRQNHDNLLGMSNRQSLDYIIDDYSQKHLLFPIDWIPSYYVKNFSSDSIIQNLVNELKAIEISCSENATQEKIIDYSSKYKLSKKLLSKGYSVLYVNDKKDIIVLVKKDQRKTYHVGEFCELEVLLNRDKKQHYNITMRPADRDDSSHQYHQNPKIWATGKSMFTIGTLPVDDKSYKPTVCTAKKIQIYIGQSDSDAVCCQASNWNNLEEYEFYFPISWE